MAELLWRSALLASSEHFIAELGDDEQRLRGTVVLPIDGAPAHLTYQVVADAGWRTRQAEVLVNGAGGRRHLVVDADANGRWTVDGSPTPSLDGCIDIDLGWTPATNTLPIRRTDLDVGQRRTLPVAWLRFPELTFRRVEQTYVRLAPTTWRYAAEEFTAVLDVDEEGFVRRYGDDIWVAIAAGS